MVFRILRILISGNLWEYSEISANIRAGILIFLDLFYSGFFDNRREGTGRQLSKAMGSGVVGALQKINLVSEMLFSDEGFIGTCQ